MHLDVILQGKLSDFLETEYKKVRMPLQKA